MNNLFKPIIFRLSNLESLTSFTDFKSANPHILVFNTIEEQLVELYKVRNPQVSTVDRAAYDKFAEAELQDTPIDQYGAWVYYPWTNRLVHLLDQPEFFEVRTNRNDNKISRAEQIHLKDKTIGIIGLSVGQSVALTMAMERICGKLRLADFDTIELSNLNRIRTSVHNLGLSKVVVVAREIAEIDPYIEVEVFEQGLHKNNMEDFLVKDSKLDLLVELCDSLDMKLACRLVARAHKIPVLMETNDRCMLDIERFDLENNRDILHGLITATELSNIDNLSPAEKLALVLKIVDKDRLSAKMKEAFTLLGHSIRSWPQLASSVTMGGGVATDVARRILLGEVCNSGRWYFDIDAILKEDAVIFDN